MGLQTPQDLLLHELSDMYDAEHHLLEVLAKFATEATSEKSRNLFQHHVEETRQQIQTLEQCFEALGSEPQPVPCHAIQGLVTEHEQFTQEQPSEQVLAMFDLGAAYKSEHYEIAAYRGLVEKANAIGLQSVALALQDCLHQEEEMEKKVAQLATDLSNEIAHQARINSGALDAHRQVPTIQY